MYTSKAQFILRINAVWWGPLLFGPSSEWVDTVYRRKKEGPTSYLEAGWDFSLFAYGIKGVFLM